MDKGNLIKGSLCMTAGFFFIALFAAFFKAATLSSSILWTVWVGYSFAGLIQFALMAKEGFAFFKTKRIGAYAGRVFFGLLSTFLYVMAIKQVSLLNATLLFNTAPLFIPIFAIFLLRTKVTLKTWGFLFLGFIGVMLILDPEPSSFCTTGNLVGLLSGVIQALAFIFVKMLTTSEPLRRINFYFFAFSSITLAPFVFWFWEAPTLESWGWALCAGAMSFLAQLFIVQGYRFADASHVGPFQYSSVLFSGIIGWLIWNQEPTLMELAGAFLIAVGGIFTLIFYKPEAKQRKT
jgi:drug/metabolite transporter (DMT)-like permease